MSAKDLFSADRPVTYFVEAVCIRPKMYTINGTLEEVGAFLEGFHSGMAAHKVNETAKKEALLWYEFCQWASQFVEGTDSGSWHYLFQALRHNYREDDTAIAKLVALYIDFRDEKDKKQNQL